MTDALPAGFTFAGGSVAESNTTRASTINNMVRPRSAVPVQFGRWIGAACPMAGIGRLVAHSPGRIKCGLRPGDRQSVAAAQGFVAKIDRLATPDRKGPDRKDDRKDDDGNPIFLA